MKCCLKICDLAASATISLPHLKHFLYQTGRNSMFSTSTMARTRIGLKLNHTQMAWDEEILEVGFTEVSESVIWMGLWSADVPAWGEGCCQLSPCTSSAWFMSQPGPQDLGSAPVGCWASSQGLRAVKAWSAQSRRNGAELKSKNPHPNLPLDCCQALNV